MIAVICGGGTLPHAVCTELTAEKKDFFVVALNPHTSGEQFNIHNASHDVVEVQWYKVESIINTLKEKHTSKVVLIGKFDKRCLFQVWKLDQLGRSLLSRINAWGDGALLKSISSFFNDYAIEVISQDLILNRQFMPKNNAYESLTQNQKNDITFGLSIAEKMSALDVSQTVIVKNKSVIAIEGIEGTNECIARAQTYGINDLIICKTACPESNKTLDIPTLGPDTLSLIKPGMVSIIAWHHDRTLIVKSETFLNNAHEKKITLVSC
jgi:DUF1009 family protein